MRGPFFDELEIGQVFADSPSVTITEGMRAVHRSIVGNRLPLALDDGLARRVTGAPFVQPSLVWDISIGQSTAVTQHVRANLFYRHLGFGRFPTVGDTLHTTTTVEALRENSVREGRPPTGLAVLHIVTKDQTGSVVLDYLRCAMLLQSGLQVGTGRRDDLSSSVDVIDFGIEGDLRAWDLAAFRAAVPGEHFAAMTVGRRWQVKMPDLVSSAPELARLTGNIATIHHDARAAGGRRLVYGGHTIGLALHQMCLAVPTLVTVLRWEGCDHTGPVYEGDLLGASIEVVGRRALDMGGGIVDLHVEVDARRDDGSDGGRVLDWTLAAVVA
ncbi:acyl dehydratase [Nakamurella sp. YIM 132087]|uniref:Acyl dehydratase n=1 Tax=Nakamurella alba TaxID=2665158 RepID=A0A7K1FGM4_9ACTN|nr:acyl dehydratase [Nakamurella alba]